MRPEAARKVRKTRPMGARTAESTGLVPRPEIAAMKAPSAPEAGERLVADGAGVVGELIEAAVRSDQLDGRAGAGELRRHLGHVEGDQIHGDAANESDGVVSDEAQAAIAERAEIAVRITNADRCYARRPADAMRRTIANAPGAVNVADLENLRVQRHRL